MIPLLGPDRGDLRRVDFFRGGISLRGFVLRGQHRCKESGHSQDRQPVLLVFRRPHYFFLSHARFL
jgi:hypothetical protein